MIITRYPNAGALYCLLFFCLLMCSIAACRQQKAKQPATTAQPDQRITDSLAVDRFVYIGDSIYRKGISIQTFVQSLKYYDSAQAIADRSGDTMMLAETAYAKGRIYDAWGREPDKILHYYSLAASYFKTQPRQYHRYIFQKYLKIHAYAKNRDTVNARKELQYMYAELLEKRDDTFLQRKMRFVPELALISAEIGYYPMAVDILANLRPRALIVNVPGSMDHLYHYYVTQAILDAEYKKVVHSAYLDTLNRVADKSKNVMDAQYYYARLARIYAALGNYQQAFHAQKIYELMRDSVMKHEDLTTMQSALLRSDLESERRKVQYEASLRKRRQQIIWTLSISLGIIALLGIFALRQSRKYKEQSIRLADVNKELDHKVDQVELLNKEIQHRIKNNLHMIYSLLQMQERKTEDEKTIEQLQTARLRVESIASLHNQLMYHQGNVDFSTFIKELVASVLACLTNDIKVVTHMNTTPVKLATNHYFALSLILNEWVTNSVKYAAVDGDVLEINVNIHDDAKQVCIEYWDNGQASPKHDASKPATPKSGLGSQIVKLLTRQMSATMMTLNDNPFHYQICVPHGPED